MTKRSKRHDRSLTGFALAALLTLPLAAGCSYEAHGSYRAGGSITSNGDVEFTDGGIDTDSRAPSFLFGTVRGKGARELSYIIVVNGADPDPQTYSASFRGTSTLEGDDYLASYLADLDGLSVSIERTAKAAASVVSEERLLIQGAPVDLSKGRLILLRDDTQGGGWDQISDPLPPAPRDVARLAEFVANTVTDLARSNSAVEEFLRR